MRQVVDLDDVEETDTGMDLYRGVPFTGPIVARSQSGDVIWIGETTAGLTHGYSVDCLSGLPTAVDEYDRGTPHGLRATWEEGRFTGASRYQYGIEDQRLRPDGTIQDFPEAAAKIARLHALKQRHEPLTASARELLVRFRDAWPNLLLEARRGLGLV